MSPQKLPLFTTFLNALEWNEPTELSFLQPKFYQSNQIISMKLG